MVVSTPLLILAITASFLVGSALVVGLCILLLVGLVAWDRQRKRKLAALASRHRLKGLEMVEENGAELASIGSAENLLSLVMHSHTPIGSPELTAMSITATTTRVLQHLDKHALVEAAEQEIALPTAPSPTPSPEAHRVAMSSIFGGEGRRMSAALSSVFDDKRKSSRRRSVSAGAAMSADVSMDACYEYSRGSSGSYDSSSRKSVVGFSARETINPLDALFVVLQPPARPAAATKPKLKREGSMFGAPVKPPRRDGHGAVDEAAMIAVASSNSEGDEWGSAEKLVSLVKRSFEKSPTLMPLVSKLSTLAGSFDDLVGLVNPTSPMKTPPMLSTDEEERYEFAPPTFSLPVEL